MKQTLSKRFHISDLGPCQYYLGIIVTCDQNNRVLRFGQRACLEKILRDYKMTNCKAAPTAMKTQHPKMSPFDYQPTIKFCPQYQSAVGILIYIILRTRPHLAYAVSVVSQYTS